MLIIHEVVSSPAMGQTIAPRGGQVIAAGNESKTRPTGICGASARTTGIIRSIEMPGQAP